MLGRNVSGSFVCLRCRLQLGGVALRRRPFSAAAAARNENHALERQTIIDTNSRADRRDEKTENHHGTRILNTEAARAPALSTTSSTIDDGQSLVDAFAVLEEANENRDNGEKTNVEDHKGGEATEELLIRRYASGGRRHGDREKSVLSSLSFDRKVYQSRGQRLLAKGEDLPIDILGKPGAAIVLRQRGAFRKQILEELDAEEVPESNGSLAETLEKESTDRGGDEALLNIHHLQPRESRALSEHEFASLKDTLIQGFTKAQLESYILDFQSATQQLGEGEQQPPGADPPWILERGGWIPTASEGFEATGDKLQAYISKSMPPKEKLVIRLMRECWDVTCQTVVEGPGRLEARLRDTEFALLTLGTGRWLREITRNLLDSGKQIDLFVPRKTISIMAPQTTAETILSEVNKVLEQSKTVSFAAKLVSPEPLDPAAIDDVGRITNTVVRLDPTGEKVLVTWINRPEPPEGLENLGDVVLRLLLYAFHPDSRTPSALDVFPSKYKSSGCRYLTSYGCEQRLPWQDRRKQWARAVVPLSDSEVGPSSDIPELVVRYPLEFGEPGEEQPAAGWSPQPRPETRAVFGHVLHAERNSSLRSSVISTVPRTFIPILPPLSALDFKTNLHEEGLWHSILILRFLPSIDQIHPTRPPPLELRLEADHREIKRVVSLRAIASSFTSDALLPAAAVDVRFLQQRYFSLPGSDVHQYASSVVDFLSRADLRPWDGKMATPPRLANLRLPRRLLLPSSSAEEASSGNDEAIDVDYLFVGLEVQRVVTTEYEGFKLGYRSIEAGQRGGKTAELFLDAMAARAEESPDVDPAESSPPSYSAASYMKAVARLANGDEFWQTKNR